MKLHALVLGFVAISAVACNAPQQKVPAAPVHLTNAMIPDPETSLELDTVDPWAEEAAPPPPARTWGTSSDDQPKLPKLDRLGNPMHL